jgi:hypothetical protein
MGASARTEHQTPSPSLVPMRQGLAASCSNAQGPRAAHRRSKISSTMSTPPGLAFVVKPREDLSVGDLGSNFAEGCGGELVDGADIVGLIGSSTWAAHLRSSSGGPDAWRPAPHLSSKRYRSKRRLFNSVCPAVRRRDSQGAGDVDVAEMRAGFSICSCKRSTEGRGFSRGRTIERDRRLRSCG